MKAALCVLVFFLISFGCSKRLEFDSISKLSNNTIEQLAMYPHPKTWKSEHVSYMTPDSSKAVGAAVGVEERCLLCHQKNTGPLLAINCTMKCHQVDNGNIKPTPLPAPVPVPNKCTECHGEMMENSFSHYPSNAGLCNTCHQVSNKHLSGSKNSVLTKKLDTDCYRCHNKKDTETVVHRPLKDKSSCIGCHNPHGGNQRYFIQEDSIKSLCLSCHKKTVVDTVVKHGPDHDQKSCTNCHNPHSAKNKKLLKLPSKELCLSCHDKEINAELNGPRVLVNIKAKLQTSSLHTGVAKGNCTSCHNPHGSENNRLLKQNYSLSNYNEYPGTGKDPYQMCFSCHDSEMLNKENYNDSTGFKDSKKNYHWSHVVDAGGGLDKTQGRACRVCHDAHGSNQDFSINQWWNMNGNPINILYSKTKDGGECTYSCHDVKVYKRDN